MIDLPTNKPRILVIGDLIIDHYLWGSCDRISPEAPVQVVNIDNENTLLGGAGNVINNLKALGAEVDVISVIGNCNVSAELVNLLLQIKIDTKFLINQKDFQTCKKTRIVAEKQQVVRYDRDNNCKIDKDTEASIVKIFKGNIKNYDLILLSDYGKGLLSIKLTQSLIKIARNNQKKILADPKGKDFSKYKGAYLLTPNKKEASEATNITINNNKTLEEAITLIKNECDLKVSIITLSEDGVAVFKNELKVHPTVAREVFDVTGAGDTILASLGFALSCKMDIDEAIKFANIASGIVVGKLGSATASLDEINQYEFTLNNSLSDNCIKTWDEISFISSELKRKQSKIVFTNGCFDILHSGHVKYLEKSKSFGDILILGLNSDESVKRLKGENRPINSEHDRACILACLKFIDYVVVFEEDSPLELIKLIKPDVLVKGGDYKNKSVVGEDIVKELKIVEFIDGKSTTRAIEEISKTNNSKLSS
jgi:D-beta-D-heptose 7-phosphate kinase / D-beta-D-heptose 1-phosphate adenosyltransferase